MKRILFIIYVLLMGTNQMYGQENNPQTLEYRELVELFNDWRVFIFKMMMGTFKYV